MTKLTKIILFALVITIVITMVYAIVVFIKSPPGPASNLSNRPVKSVADRDPVTTATATTNNNDVTLTADNPQSTTSKPQALGESTANELSRYMASLPNNVAYGSDDWCFQDQVDPSDHDEAMRDMRTARWQRGFFTDEERAVYAGYDETTLLTLFEQGDLLAYSVLSKKRIVINEPGDYEKGLKKFYALNLLAAAKGATAGLGNTGVNLLSRASTRQEKGDTEAANNLYKLGLAYLEVAFSTGDFSMFHLKPMLDDMEMEFTEQEFSDISSRKEKILSRIKNIRQEMNIPEPEYGRDSWLLSFYRDSMAKELLDKTHPWLTKVSDTYLVKCRTEHLQYTKAYRASYNK